MSLTFDFGRNWEAFSAAKLDAQRLHAAAESLRQLIGEEAIAGTSFLDVGCGSGLFSIAAAKCGASRVVGFDASQTAIQVCSENMARLADELCGVSKPQFSVGDVLDEGFVAELGTFDIVYAWGVLHHTGSMWQAMRNTASLVNPGGGILVLAIYNYHWTSPAWNRIKQVYNLCPGFARRLLNYVLGVLIFVVKWAVTGRNPMEKDRGMDFWYDVIDWLGGYPYEYAEASGVIGFVEGLGYRVCRVVRPKVPTGCNEFVFRRGVADSQTFMQR